MRNDNFNTPLTGDRELINRKKDLGRELDELKHAGQLTYSLHTKAIQAINYAQSMEELNQISQFYNPIIKAA
jgi:hypothetical protein